MSEKKYKLTKRKVLLIFIVVLSMLSSSFVFQNVNSSPSSRENSRNVVATSASSLYLVQFQETGLPPASSNSGYGSIWAVKVAGQVHESSTPTIALYMTPALDIQYSVVNLANYSSSPSSGVFNVSSSNVVINIAFTPSLYHVSFSETGLPSAGSATEWTIMFNGNRIYSNESVITLTEPNGKYSYSIANESIYVPSPSSGTVIVNGSSLVIPVQFTNNLESVTFFETGLPVYNGGTQSEWSVDILNSTNNLNASESSFNSSITFTVPSGNYTYTVSQIPTYSIIGGKGMVSVAKKFTSVHVTYVTEYYGIEFEESGLPSVVPVWSVSLKDLSSKQVITDYSTQTSIYFNVTDGNYQFNVSRINGYSSLPSTGYVNVNNGFYIVKIKYSSEYSNVTFKENGLFSNTTSPSATFGSYWSVTMINATGYHFIRTTDGTSITFWLPSGSYTYYTANITGFSSGNETGSIQLQGQVTVHVTYSLTQSLSQSTGTLAAINLYEQGLSAGTTWSVALSNSSSSASSQITSSALVTYYVPTGDYFLRILDSGYMHPDPSYMYISVNTATQTVYNYTINFVSTLGYLNFTEAGLLHGTSWTVDLLSTSGVLTTYSSLFNNLSIPLPNGTYFYTVLPSSSNINPFDNSSGFVYVSTTHSVSYDVVFHSDQYTITFNERGLPDGQSWNLVLMNQNGTISAYSVTSGQVNLPLVNGTYRVSAETSSGGFISMPSLISFLVNGSASSLVQHNLTFVSNSLQVSFVETGLPSGTQWSVTLNGNTQATSLGTISFTLSGGTYLYYLSSTGQYSPIQSIGVVSVASNNKTISIDFRSIDSSVTFQTTSLPANSSWTVYVNGEILHTLNQSILLNLPNGTYQFQVVNQGYYYPTQPYGLFTVSGKSISIQVNFVSILYTVSFKEAGLPLDLAWTVLVSNQTGVIVANTSSTQYNNLSLLNGSYSFSVLETDYYVSIPGNGSFSVNGGVVALSVQYKIFKYSVNFVETGLPAGDIWNITLTSQTGTFNTTSTTGSTASFSVVNGTYTFIVVSADKNVAPSPMTGTVIVSGTAENISVTFSPVLFTAQIDESGLAKDTGWSISINNVTYSTKNTSINVTLVNGTYDFTVLNVTAGYTYSPASGKVIVKGSNITTTITYTVIVTIITSKPPPKTNYNTYIVLGTLVGIGVIGLGVIMALYYQRKKS
ncbi:MAG: hypothetical protein M1327_07230 [Candidatus Thermoplasmatota archaeon]|nr:hypothetical protein [Candidatus Thermoplasmatota archaeon]